MIPIVEYPISLSFRQEETIRAIYWFASDYHGGQNSRGYRLACRCLRLMHRNGRTGDPFSTPLGRHGSAVYARLEANGYGEKI